MSLWYLSIIYISIDKYYWSIHHLWFLPGIHFTCIQGSNFYSGFNLLVQESLLLFICLVVSDSLQPHGLQHARLPCSSLPPGTCSKSCPLNWWCHPTISSSIVPSSCHLSFPASGSFPMSQLFASCGQSIGALALASILPMNIQGWFLLEKG